MYSVSLCVQERGGGSGRGGCALTTVQVWVQVDTHKRCQSSKVGLHLSLEPGWQQKTLVMLPSLPVTALGLEVFLGPNKTFNLDLERPYQTFDLCLGSEFRVPSFPANALSSLSHLPSNLTQ